MRTNRLTALLLPSALALLAGCATGPGGLASTNFDDAAKKDVMPTPPPGAQYTIVCQTYTSADHAALADKARDMLRDNVKKLHQWYVVHQSDKSILYYGFYRCNDPRDTSDAAEGQRAVDDQNLIRSISDSHGSKLFPTCILQPIEYPDPAEKQEWALLQSPGYWSLEIGVFKGTPDRKEKALAVVKDLRSRGEDAYYFHGPTMSSVCIGSWPKKSVLELNVRDQNSDPTVTKVVSNTDLPNTVVLPGDARLLKPTVEIEDPTLIQALQTHHEHWVNGITMERTITDAKTGRETKVDEQPLLVRIPDRADSGSMAVADPALSRKDDGYNVPAPAPVEQQDPLDDPGTRALRELSNKGK